jgi:hypothetical protein
VKEIEQPTDQAKQPANPSGIMDGSRIISYNLNEQERPGGLKVRVKVRIVKGKTAAATDAQQAEAIRELLLWVRQQRQHQRPSP